MEPSPQLETDTPGIDVPEIEPRKAEASGALEEAVAAERVPVPVSKPVVKESLWRRMTLRGGSHAKASKVDKAAAQQDLVKSRLDGITLRLESIEHALTRSDEKFDERLARLWEIEEQLESLQDLGERTTEARDAALDAARAAEHASSVASVAAVLAGLAVLVAAASIAVPGLSL
jgi:hypothetical protein